MQSLSDFQAAQRARSSRSARRPTPEQARALETLGHAIEYLIDESLLSGGDVDTDVTDAVQLLSAASREVYLACTEVTRDSTRGTRAHVRWRWLPQARFMLPMFRTAGGNGASER